MWSISPCLLAEPNSQPRPGDTIVARIDALKRPQFDWSKRHDPAFRQPYFAEQDAYLQTRAESAKELWEVEPTHPRALEPMLKRWREITGYGKLADALAEIDTVKASLPAHRWPDLDFNRAEITLMANQGNSEKMAAVGAAFAKAHSMDRRRGDLLMMAASSTPDRERWLSLGRRLATEYPTSPWAALARGIVRRGEGIGTPFELSFTDAISGRHV
ncbi:MAG: hypothetical protein NZ561_12695, partial [Phycisphaerae bacterium]|nr:hypothetical protein [Phycisphaerae bacterium]MDW8261493.1 hypothetical protein [Phycisphaerales bacterium]